MLSGDVKRPIIIMANKIRTIKGVKNLPRMLSMLSLFIIKIKAIPKYKLLVKSEDVSKKG